MKTIAKTFLSALALCASAAAFAQSAEYSSSEAKFAVSFPSPPKESRREDKTAEGRIVVTHFQAVDDGKRYFSMSWVQMPVTPKDKKARDRVLESAATGALKSIAGGVLVSKKKVTVSKVAGLEYVVDAPKEAQRLRQRVFLIGDKLVQQTYSGPKGSETDASVKKFIQSLKFLP